MGDSHLRGHRILVGAFALALVAAFLIWRVQDRKVVTGSSLESRSTEEVLARPRAEPSSGVRAPAQVPEEGHQDSESLEQANPILKAESTLGLKDQLKNLRIELRERMSAAARELEAAGRYELLGYQTSDDKIQLSQTPGLLQSWNFVPKGNLQEVRQITIPKLEYPEAYELSAQIDEIERVLEAQPPSNK